MNVNLELHLGPLSTSKICAVDHESYKNACNLRIKSRENYKEIIYTHQTGSLDMFLHSLCEAGLH